MEKKLFYEGKLFDAYRYFGCHQKGAGFQFTTYAPNARKIAIVGDFTNWEEEWMSNDGGIYHFASKKATVGDFYKYRIYKTDTEWTEHTDPYAFQMELRPGCCAVVTDLSGYQFTDDEWIRQRSTGETAAVNIYELHFGSWRTHAGEPYRYDQLGDLLIPYLQDNHYTHVEFMPLMEHPFDGSWGYQVTGFFAPTSRYGSPAQLMKLIDRLHQAGIGAILDFVPVHFAIDSYGLKEYDGTPLYEYPHGDVTESEWGTCNFIYNRREVQCFMQSAAHFWLEEYHFDGLRMDAVSRMIYWHGDEARGINPNSLDFLKQMNQGLKMRHPACMLIAEDSSTYPGVTRAVAEGGLGFDYKWSLGWMHDTLEYFQTGPAYRPDSRHKLTFAMSYFSDERYILELSHDENVHGKATILQKMSGEYEEKFPQGRLLYLFMTMHPGKKLNFMGYEIGQLREWDEKREQDWDILKYPKHSSFHKYIQELNRIYLSQPTLHNDYLEDGCRWLDFTSGNRMLFAMAREEGAGGILLVFNTNHLAVTEATLMVSEKSRFEILLHSDWECYGGKTKRGRKKYYNAVNGRLKLNIPAYSGILFKYDKKHGLFPLQR